jgi:snurportin-1
MFRKTKQNDGFCILDCIYNAIETSSSDHEGTYYVLDVLCWKGYPIHDSEAEFRLFWLQNKLEECGYTQRNAMCTNSVEFHWLPLYSIESKDNIDQFYSRNAMESIDRWGFQQDGVLFFNKHAHYISSTNPFILFWKDSSCSPYSIEEENFQFSNDGQRQFVTLKIEEGNILTLDDCLISSMTNEIDSAMHAKEAKSHPHNLYKFSVLDIIAQNLSGLHQLEEHSGLTFQVEVIGLKYESDCSRSKIQADHLSKILFNRNAVNNCGIRISDIAMKLE